MAKSASEGKTIKVTLVRSAIGYPKPQKATVRALGLRRLNQTVEHKDTPALRGMLAKVVHLIRIEE
ncbi:MAG: large subunit ribosomal protein L30 [Anaerolineaceae bacterium]|nr:MAG: large subunit ribosomal protein L30 [Anaerolineaceae bacterium]